MKAILWFRQDLRLEDNPALVHGALHYSALLPLYILDDTVPILEQIGSAQKWWLYHSLKALCDSLKKKYGVSLLLLKGDPKKLLPALIQKVEAQALVVNKLYSPHERKRDVTLFQQLGNDIEIKEFNGLLLFNPSTILSKTQQPYKLYSAFYKNALMIPPSLDDLEAPPPSWPGVMSPSFPGDLLDKWNLIPHHPNWSRKFESLWQPGEKGAHSRLTYFIEHSLKGYKENRDFPDKEKTSYLSPHLHFGEIHPLRIWKEVKTHLPSSLSTSKFLSELAWRDFAYYQLFHFPSLINQNLNKKFIAFPWKTSSSFLEKWQKGQTGYPLIDAGMRQLWATGWMHNRVRMVAASFLTKNLFIDWRVGAQWFRDTLLDGDLASNSINWQWVAGTGIEASPYFRIFNPILQSQKFDPHGDYIKTWVPELKKLSSSYIHAPWKAPADTLKKAGVTLGENYPLTLVDFNETRIRALACYKNL